MKKPIHRTLTVKLIIIIFCVAVAYLIYKSFMDGYAEGRQTKEAQEKAKGI
jgi:hypothetical protein